MANLNTKIEWTDATWSPVTGCTKVSAGCANCYAERIFPRVYSGVWVKRSDGLMTRRRFTDVRTHPDRLDAPLHWRKPRRVFVNSMSDLLHEDVPDTFVLSVFSTMHSASAHSFQILTKRPQRMLTVLQWLGRKFAQEDEPWPLPNVWLGVSVEDQATADERIPLLLQTPAAVRFVSYEPALGAVDLGCVGGPSEDPDTGHEGIDALRWRPMRQTESAGLDWVIAGAESGPKARPSDVEWFRSVRDQCAEAGVPFFMKQITERGRKVPFDEWPEDLKVREWPAEERREVS